MTNPNLYVSLHKSIPKKENILNDAHLLEKNTLGGRNKIMKREYGFVSAMTSIIYFRQNLNSSLIKT